MSISNQDLVVEFTGNGSTTTFPFTFTYFDADQVKVSVNGAPVSSGFIVDSENPTAGGSIIFEEAPAIGDKIVILRITPRVRTSDFIEGGVLSSAALDGDFDYLTAITQELDQYALQRDEGTAQWNANNLRIENLVVPVNSSDASNKLYVDQVVTRLGNLTTPLNPADNGKWLKANAGAATWENITNANVVSYLGYTPANKAGDTITGNLTISGTTTHTGTSTFNGNTVLNSATNTINNAQFTNSPTGPTPALFDDSTKLATTEFIQDALWAGNKIRLINHGRKSGNGMGIIMNNQIFISGQFSHHIGKAGTVGVHGFVHVPFKNADQIPAGTTIVDAAICGWSLYVWLSNGWCYTAGTNAQYQLGHGDAAHKYSLTRVEYFVTNNISIDKVFVPDHIYCDDETTYHSAWYRATNGTLYACGYNGNGELGIGNVTSPISTPTPVLNISNVIMFSCGQNGGGHCIAVSSNNPKQVWTWGYNYCGSLGNGTVSTNSNQPVVVYTHTSNITKVQAAQDHYYNGAGWYIAKSSIFLAGGEIWTTGYNGYGQLGVGSIVDKQVFTKTTGSQVWVDFDASCGYQCSLYAIDNAGAVWSTGYNGYGQLGVGSSVDKNIFTLTNITSGAVSLRASCISTYGTVIVKKSNGYLYSCGYNGYGAVAQGNCSYPATVNSFGLMVGPLGYQAEDYMIISDLYNRYENCAFVLLKDGSLLATGINVYGILANRDISYGYNNDQFDYCSLPK